MASEDMVEARVVMIAGATAVEAHEADIEAVGVVLGDEGILATNSE